MKIFRNFFLLIGLLSGLVLCACDYWTSVVGLWAFLPQNDDNLMMRVLPWSLSALALAMNGCASRMIQRLRKGTGAHDEANTSLVFLVFVFGTCLLYDLASSWAGFITMITMTPQLDAAIEIISTSQFIGSTLIALMSCLGPYIVTLFADEMREEGGLLGELV